MNPTIQQIETRAAAANVSMLRILQSAGVNHSTWWRWRKAKFQPRQAKLDAVLKALAEHESSPA